MIGLVPALEPLARINGKQHIRSNAADDCGGLFGELGLWRILQHAVVVTHPGNIFFGSAKQALRSLFFRLADSGQTLRTHFRIVGPFIIIRVNNYVNSIVVAIQKSDRATGAEHIVIWMWRKHQNRLALHLLQALRLRQELRRNHEENRHQNEVRFHGNSPRSAEWQIGPGLIR